MTAGELRVDATNAVLGVELAADLGLTVGDKVRLATPAGRSDTFLVAGIFDVGNEDPNELWVFASGRAAQALLDLASGISTTEMLVAEIFAAERVAEEFVARTGLQADSWIIQFFFVAVAVALGIASDLVVSVVPKFREIGILKAMRTRTAQVVRIVLVQGTVLGLAGSVFGSALGAGLSFLFASLAKNPDGSAPFR